MIKLVTTLAKRQDISTEDFRNYYENTHRLIGEKYLRDYAIRYVRRYVNPVFIDMQQPPDFDVLLEIWFADRATFEACSKKLSEPKVAEEIAADEEKLFDRNRKKSYLIEERESILGSSNNSSLS